MKAEEIVKMAPAETAAKLKVLGTTQISLPVDRAVLEHAATQLLDFADVLFAAELVTASTPETRDLRLKLLAVTLDKLCGRAA